MYNSIKGISVVKDGGSVSYNHKKFICDTVAEKDQIEVSKVAPGSTALVIETKEVYILSNAKKWVLFTTYSGTSSIGGGTVVGDYLDSDDIASLSDASGYLNI